jgi:energy-converting hydrogenase Eha subunit B
MKKLSLALTGLYLASPVAAMAQIDPPCDGLSCNPDANAEKIITTVITWILGIAALIAVLMLIIGGILYVTAAGNTDRAKQARQTILYAVIGLIVIVLAYFIVAFVTNFAIWFGDNAG